MPEGASRNRQAIRERIEALLNILATPEIIENGIKFNELAKRLGIGERTVRNYIKDLEDYDLVQITAKGRIKLSPKAILALQPQDDILIDPLEKSEELTLFSPEVRQKTFEEFIALIEQHSELPKYLWEENALALTKDKREVQKITNFLAKIESPLRNWPEIKDQILQLVPTKIVDPNRRIKFFGDKLVISGIIRPLEEEKIFTLSGLATKSKPKIWWIKGVASLFPVLLSTAGFTSQFNGISKVGKPQRLILPKGKTLSQDDLPKIELPELITSYGDISDLPLRVAARLLSTMHLYDSAATLLESSENPVDYLFINGVLYPHGFYYPSGSIGRSDPAYLNLMRDVTKSLARFVKIARKSHTVIVGYSTNLKDTKFSKTVFTQLNQPVLKMPDSAFMTHFLHDRDSSCLFQRVEAGKPELITRNSFEFYMNIRNQIVGIEFLKLHEKDDVKKMHQDIASIVYTVSQPLIYRKRHTEQEVELLTPLTGLKKQPIQVPFVLQEAISLADTNMITLERLLEVLIHDIENSIRKHIGKVYDSVPIFDE